MKADFDRAFELVIGHEGGLTLDGNDRGNWTGGNVGKGILRGTKYGISAMSYPAEDIANLTLDRAKDIYKRHYWDHLHCSDMPNSVAFSVFDAGVNCGVCNAAEWLQRLLGVTVDGKIGPMTLQALAQRSAPLVAAKFNAMRLEYHTNLPKWALYGKGWSRRIASNIQMLGD